MRIIHLPEACRPGRAAMLRDRSRARYPLLYLIHICYIYINMLLVAHASFLRSPTLLSEIFSPSASVSRPTDELRQHVGIPACQNINLPDARGSPPAHV